MSAKHKRQIPKYTVRTVVTCSECSRQLQRGATCYGWPPLRMCCGTCYEEYKRGERVLAMGVLP